jgi:hypothetical protein
METGRPELTNEDRAASQIKRKAYGAAYRENNRQQLRDKNKEYYRANKEAIDTKNTKYARENREKTNAYSREWRKTSEKHKQWTESFREEKARKQREWRATSPAWKASVIRNREKNRVAYQKYTQTEAYKIRYEQRKVENREKQAKYAIERYHAQRQHYRDYQFEKPSRRAAVMIKWELCGKLCYLCGLELPFDDVVIEHVYPAILGGSNGISNLMPAHSKCNLQKCDRVDYPFARPDLIYLVAHVEAVPVRKGKFRGRLTPESQPELVEV